MNIRYWPKNGVRKSHILRQKYKDAMVTVMKSQMNDHEFTSPPCVISGEKDKN